MHEITVADVDWLLSMLTPDVEPSPDMVRAIAESPLAREQAGPDSLDDAIAVVRRVAAARDLPED